MEVMLSRILKYLNGCLDDNHLYKIGNFIVKNLTEMDHYTQAKMVEEGQFTKAELLDFCSHFGYHSFKDFQNRLLTDDEMRLEQIHARMLNMDISVFIDHLDIEGNKEDILPMIDELCDLIFKKKRIFICGGLYPLSLSVDFQTDLITLGKEVNDYHHLDKNIKFNENDMVIFMTATGRMYESYIKEMQCQHICEADLVLITQNIKYRDYEDVLADYYIHVLSKYDGIQFNYQLMMIFDLLRIRYYQKFYRLETD